MLILKMTKYKLYYYIIIFFIIKCVFGDLNDLEVIERTWEEDTEGNIVKFFLHV